MLKLYIKNIFLLILLLFLLTGCNYKEVNDMPMVNGMGIDKHDNIIYITLSIIIPASGSGEPASENVLVEAEGETLFEAVRDLIIKDGEKVYFGHLQYLLLGHELASENINEVIDLIIRDDETREDIWLIISAEDTSAKEILLTGIKNESFPFYIPTALKNSGSISKYYPVTICEFAVKENNKGAANVIPMASLENSTGQERIVIHGGYVIKDNKATGLLLGKDIQTYRLIIDEEDGGIHVIDYEKDTLTSKVSIEIINSKTNMKITKNNQGEYIAKLEANITGVIGEISNSDLLIVDENNLADFKKQAEKQIKEEIDALINKVKREDEVDIFGFGSAFKIAYPKQFKEFENNWNDVFIGLKIETKVNVEIKGSSLCRQPLYGGQ